VHDPSSFPLNHLVAVITLLVPVALEASYVIDILHGFWFFGHFYFDFFSSQFLSLVLFAPSPDYALSPIPFLCPFYHGFNGFPFLSKAFFCISFPQTSQVGTHCPLN